MSGEACCSYCFGFEGGSPKTPTRTRSSSSSSGADHGNPFTTPRSSKEVPELSIRSPYPRPGSSRSYSAGRDFSPDEFVIGSPSSCDPSSAFSFAGSEMDSLPPRTHFPEDPLHNFPVVPSKFEEYNDILAGGKRMERESLWTEYRETLEGREY